MKPGHHRKPHVWRTELFTAKSWVKCAICGREFVKSDSARRWNHDCCSRECALEFARGERNSGQDAPVDAVSADPADSA